MPRSLPSRLPSALPALLATALSCGSGPPAAAVGTAPEPLVLEGSVTYERRVPTERGLTPAVETRPARRISVQAVDEAGVIQAASETDEQGHYRLRVPRPTPVRVRATSVITADGFDLRVLQGPHMRQLHELSSALVGAEPGAHRVDLHATVGGAEPAGAFHILDRFLDGVRTVEAAIGVRLPPLIGLWRRGNTQSEAHTSFFTGASQVTAGAWELQLMGGEAARPDQSDSDQFDSGIILHELGHFVNRILGADPSIAGSHDRRRSMVPGVAFDEAFATFFACAVLRDPLYLDTVGVQPVGSVRMREHLEDAGPTQLRGVGTETTTFEILWDLADGTAELPDHDGDGVAVGLAGVLRVIQSFERSRDDYPYIGLFLQRAIRLGVLTEAQVIHIIKEPRAHGLSWPLAGDDVWPVDLTLPARVLGKVDGVTDPQRAGGPPDPHNGFDAVQVYRLRVARPSRLSATLRIQGSGRGADRQDVDLVLYDINTDQLGAATAEQPTEELHVQVQAGSYLLYVRDGGSGNRASYSLDVRAD